MVDDQGEARELLGSIYSDGYAVGRRMAETDGEGSCRHSPTKLDRMLARSRTRVRRLSHEARDVASKATDAGVLDGREGRRPRL